MKKITCLFFIYISCSFLFSQNDVKVVESFYMNTELYSCGPQCVELCFHPATVYTNFIVCKVVVPTSSRTDHDSLQMTLSIPSIDNSTIRMKFCENSSRRGLVSDTLMFYALVPEKLLHFTKKTLSQDLHNDQNRLGKLLEKTLLLSYYDVSKHKIRKRKLSPMTVLYDEESQKLFLNNDCSCIKKDPENLDDDFFIKYK